MKTMIGDECSLLHVAENAPPDKPTSDAHLVGSLSEDSALQIMSAAGKDSVAFSLLLTDKRRSEENVSDIDLNFLSEADISDPKHLSENVVKELQGMMASSPPPLNLNFLESSQPEVEFTQGDTVMIDVSQPIQLSQNSLIVVNGQKCVLQHDPRTGQAVAYPVRERPRRRRGRPRKTSVEQVFVQSEKNLQEDTENLSEEEREKGLLEVVNDDGSLVRRSSRKRKKAKALKDYETGSLQQELGSDVEDAGDAEQQPFLRRRRPRGPGRPRKFPAENVSLENPAIQEGEGVSQAFLVQTSDGQTLVLQVPLSSIPDGTSLQQMAQHIASKLNGGLTTQAKGPSCEPALQDHSIGSTTTSFLQQEICEPQEVTLQCDQSLNVVTSGENVVENNLDAPVASLEDNFCLDVSSTTNSTSVDGLCPFSDHLIDHSLYVMRPKEKDLFQVESNIILSDPSSDLLVAVAENKDVVLDAENADEKDPAQPPPVVIGMQSKGSEVLTVILQEPLSSENTLLLPTAEIPPGTKKCKICAVPYSTEEEIVEHFKARHPKCICLECNYMNEHPYGIKRHSYRHASQECVCNICNKKYKDAYILKMHVKQVHLPPECLFHCDTCQKEFTRKAHLKRHQRTHAPTRQYKCTRCEYQGCEKSDVTKHSLIHEEPKFKCEVCGKAFRHMKNKELHVKRHSGQRDYKCAACNFYGYTYTDIRKHIERRHSATCHLCRQAFADPQLCKEHKRLGLCQPSLLEATKVEACPPATLDDKKEIVLFGEVALDI